VVQDQDQLLDQVVLDYHQVFPELQHIMQVAVAVHLS
jgi:hypothetical protein